MSDDDNNATFKLLVDKDPKRDSLILYVQYRNVYIEVHWLDSERQDVVDLLNQKNPTWFLDRGHLEYEVHRQSFQIDGDLDRLFPDDDTDEEVETGE